MRELWRNWRWERLRRQAPANSAVHAMLAGGWPEEGGRALNSPTLALDLETTGLDPRNDSIVSVGCVCIDDGRVVLSSARRWIVRSERPLPARSVVVHRLGDDQVAAGEPLRDTMSELLPLLAGRVLVAHNAQLDAAFLAAACRSLWMARVAFPSIDTLALLERLHRRRGRVLAAHSLTLAAARAQFGLPRYPEHDALWDAIAVAELWLALRIELAGGAQRPLPLRRVLQWLP